MRGVFALDEPTGARWRLALDLLRNDHAFALGRITFRRVDATTVEASVASAWQMENVSDAYALSDLEQAKSETEALLRADQAFRDIVGSSSIDYALVDDYDTGGVTLCRLSDVDVERIVDPPS